jgi:hypothetical protein
LVSGGNLESTIAELPGRHIAGNTAIIIAGNVINWQLVIMATRQDSNKASRQYIISICQQNSK